jgi:hypothetical protein
MGTIEDEVALPCNAEHPAAMNSPVFPPIRTFCPLGRGTIIPRGDKAVLESGDEVRELGPGASTPTASNASVNKPELAITPTINLETINAFQMD